MEITKLGEKSLRIKSKNATFIVDPLPKAEANAFIFTTAPEVLPENLSLYGPGEFEIAGVSIKAERAGETVSYDLLEDGRRILVLAKPTLVKDYETEEYNAVILALNEKVDDAVLSNISSELVVLYGDEAQIALDPQNVKKAEKINLKKTEELKGFTIFLTK